MSSRTAHQLGFSFEYLMWIFTRISGLALILLSTFGITAALWLGARTQMDLGTLMRWTFFPNSNHVVSSEIPDLVPYWANAFWNVMQILIVFFGVTHGMNGLRVVVEDYLGSTWVKTFLRGLIFLLWPFIILISVYVILTY